MSGEDRQSQLAREHKERQAQRAARTAAKSQAERSSSARAWPSVVVAGGIYRRDRRWSAAADKTTPQPPVARPPLSTSALAR